MKGQIIANHGRHYVVACADGRQIQAYPRSKRSEYVTGDWVVLQDVGATQAVICEREPRNSLLYRSDSYQRKILAANLTQIIVVIATQPSFSEEFLSRTLVAAASLSLPVYIILNKVDLSAHLSQCQHRLVYYQQCGYPIYLLSAKYDGSQARDILLPIITGHTSLLIGQSGMGKSTLLNLLIPNARIKTNEISYALDSGKHTTTATHLYRINSETAIIDSPGFQEFGLHHLSKSELEYAFIDFVPYLGECRFNNCCHENEPGCAITAAVKEGKVLIQRQRLFAQLLQESEKQY